MKIYGEIDRSGRFRIIKEGTFLRYHFYPTEGHDLPRSEPEDPPDLPEKIREILEWQDAT